ncbi:hypothetical protein AABD61_13190 [Edwardsiella piscicida]|uniref:hypothetical protein n=1 Tax=Edwardsiella piscicida TaxID=1263550 RepID=UPI00370D4437
MSDQKINQLENKIFKLEQSLIASSFRGDIAYRTISALSLLVRDDDVLQKRIIEIIKSLSPNTECNDMDKSIFEEEKKHAISAFLDMKKNSE